MTKKILICDGEEGVRESLKLILGDFYELILTENGAQCVEILKNARDVGLVLLDIKMPQDNGLDVLKAIKARYPALKIIIVAGYRSVETAAEAVRLGANGYIVKPFKVDEILSTIRGSLR